MSKDRGVIGTDSQSNSLDKHFCLYSSTYIIGEIWL